MSKLSSTQSVTLSTLTLTQRRVGAAAWFGWLFDGLDGYLYVLVATSFVGQLMNLAPSDPVVAHHAAFIQAAFLVGWALGGAFFGRIGDKIGRVRTLSLTILTYALFTGLSSFAVNWQMLLAFRFLTALGIGGEWAAGASLVAETWPPPWRAWAGAGLQSAFQCGLLLAGGVATLLAGNDRWVFLAGALPAVMVFWLRKSVPESEAWHKASIQKKPSVAELFKGRLLRTTVLTILVCSFALTLTWAFIFWFPQQLLRLKDLENWSPQARQHYIAEVTVLVNFVAIGGNFFAAAIAKYFGYRRSAVLMFLGSGLFLWLTYGVPRNHISIILPAVLAHFFVQGIFGLFPLYVPMLFPTLLRTTGAGFCYNIGRVVAAFGTIFFGVILPIKDLRIAILYLALLTIPAICIAMLIPEPMTEEKEAR